MVSWFDLVVAWALMEEYLGWLPCLKLWAAHRLCLPTPEAIDRLRRQLAEFGLSLAPIVQLPAHVMVPLLYALCVGFLQRFDDLTLHGPWWHGHTLPRVERRVAIRYKRQSPPRTWGSSVRGSPVSVQGVATAFPGHVFRAAIEYLQFMATWKEWSSKSPRSIAWSEASRLGCPEQAITKVPRRFVALLEYAMAKSKSLKGRRNPFDLLGLAHCRIELGEAPADAELREEYQEMTSMVLKEPLRCTMALGTGCRELGPFSKEDFREARTNILLKYTDCDADKKREAADIIAKNGRPLSQAGDDDEPGVFVDETACSRCYKSPERGEKAHAFTQDAGGSQTADGSLRKLPIDADATEILEAAVKGCPSRAISFVRKAEVPLLELAMRESVEMAQNSGVLKGPWEILEGYLVEDIIRMDLELQNFQPAQTRRDMKSLAETKDTADEISSAAQAIPEEIWWGKTQLQQLGDVDGDGFLYSEELKTFAKEMGFEGSDSEWSQEYVMICTEVGCDPTRGLDFRGFSRMVDDEEDRPVLNLGGKLERQDQKWKAGPMVVPQQQPQPQPLPEGAHERRTPVKVEPEDIGQTQLPQPTGQHPDSLHVSSRSALELWLSLKPQIWLGRPDKIWARLPQGVKEYQVKSSNDAFEKHISQHKTWQGYLLAWKDLGFLAAAVTWRPVSSHRRSFASLRWTGVGRWSVVPCTMADGMRVPTTPTIARATPMTDSLLIRVPHSLLRSGLSDRSTGHGTW
eukprot:s242_g5.t1